MIPRLQSFEDADLAGLITVKFQIFVVYSLPESSKFLQNKLQVADSLN